jgi:hypothetical protein
MSDLYVYQNEGAVRPLKGASLLPRISNRRLGSIAWNK